MPDRSPRPAPRFSIITPCLNRAQFVQAAIESVLAQDYPDFEHIIIDGGSTDGSLAVLAQYPHLRAVSEPDQGIYDALNKGLALATGDIIGFLNTDDLYSRGVFSELAAMFSTGDADFIAGQVEIFRDGSESTPRLLPSGITEHLLEDSILGNMPFNAFFFRKEVFDQAGGFDSSFRIIGDREFMMRLALAGPTAVEVARVVYRYREHPGSLTFDSDERKYDDFVDESLLWAERWLENPDCPSEARVYFSEMCTRNTLWACRQRILRHEMAGALRYARQGVRHDAFWVFRFVRHALIFLARQARGPRSRRGG